MALDPQAKAGVDRKWISEHAQRPVTKQCGWLYLQRLDYRLRVTRPRHAKADPQAQEAFKNLPHIVRQVQAEQPGVPVELWAFDEHRIGLKPVLRRVWVRRGSQPVAVVHQRYEWLYLYGFVQPQTGATSWWLLPTVRTDVFSQVLAAFAREVGAGPAKHVVLVLDNAGWHTSTDLQIPDGLHLVFLPPYSPELQPAERLWPLTNTPLLNRTFASLDDLIAVQSDRCCALSSQAQRIRRYPRYHWWPLIQ